MSTKRRINIQLWRHVNIKQDLTVDHFSIYGYYNLHSAPRILEPEKAFVHLISSFGAETLLEKYIISLLCNSEIYFN